jgi:RNA polymerase sigma factor (sigma-70 family)
MLETSAPPWETGNMATDLAQLVHHVRRLVVPPEPVADAVLLERFTRDREESAFAALVARHGPMVMRVCQRVLSDAAAAEDCFQAAFLVLARKANSIRHPASLAGWLHGVALRVAKNARKVGYRRRLGRLPAGASEPPDPHPDPLEQLTARELLIALEEEVQRLPEVYRLPVILCCLENLSQEETARRLGWTAGSVKARLERGRKRLHARLAKRGLRVSAALTIAALPQGAVAAAIAPGLRAATARAATLFAAGVAAKGVETSGAARALADAALRSTPGKLKVFALLGFIAMATAAAGTAIVGKPANGNPQSPPPPLAQAEPVQPARTPDSGPRLDKSGDPLPSGAAARLGTLRFRGNYHFPMALSPDGRRAISVYYDETRLCDVTTGKTIWRFDNKTHGGHAVAYSPNGRLAASIQDNAVSLADRRPAVYLWEAETGKQLAKLDLKMRGTECLAFAPDGITLAAGGFNYGRTVEERSSNGVVGVWRWTGSAFKPLWEAKTDLHKGAMGRRPPGIRSLAFSPDGKHLATGGLASGMIRIWDAAHGKELRQVKGLGSEIHSLAFAPSGRVFLSGSEAGAVELWETATGARKWQSKQPGEVLTVAFTPDEQTIVAGGGAGYWATDVKRHEPFLVMLRPSDGREVGRVRTDQNSVSAVGFSKDGKIFAAGLGSALRVWEGLGGKERTAQNGHEDGIASVAVSEDSKTAATGASDGVIILWDLATGKERQRLTGHTGLVQTVAFVPGGKLLASAASDQTVRLWDLATANETQRLTGSAEADTFLYAAAVAPDGKTLAAGYNHLGIVHVWNVATGQLRHTLKLGDGRGVMCLAFSPDANTLTCGDRLLRYDEVELPSHIHVWDAITGKKLAELPAGKFAVDSLSFSPDGQLLASTGTFDKAVALWDLAAGKAIFKLPCASGQGVAAFSPDGKTLAWGSSSGEAWGNSSGEVLLWEMATKKPRRKFAGHSARVKSLSFSPDGQTLVSGSTDTTAMVWDVTGLGSVSMPPGPLTSDKLRSLWAALASSDAAEAGRSLWLFTTDPKRAVPFITGRLYELPPGDPQRIPKLAADLDSPLFKAREAAERKLQALGKLAEPGLRAVLAGRISLEFRRRIENLLAKREEPIQSPQVLQTLRAIEALEHMPMPESRRGLEEFARHTSEAHFQEQARAAADRLSKRAGRQRSPLGAGE